MRKGLLFAVLLLLIVAMVPATAQVFDNSGGGTWKEYMSFPINTAVAEYSQYKIEINGAIWKIYNAEGNLKVSGTNNNFWNLVNPNGSDIRVFNDSGAQIYFWIEEWNYTNQKAVIWVNLTTGSKELNIAYGNPCATESNYNNATKVFEFFDDLETWTGWTNYGSGVVSQSSTVAYHGEYSLKKDLYGDPSGGYKPLGKTLGRDIVLEFWVDRTYLSGADADRIGLIDNNGNGYGWGYGVVNPNVLWIDIRSSYAGTSVASVNPSVNIGTNQWYRGKLIIKSDGTIIAKVYTNDSEESLGGATSITDTTYNTFTRVYVFGGYTYYVDLIKIYKASDPANFGTPVIKQFGKLLEKGLATNITYLSQSLPADTLYVNVTNLDTGAVSTYNPIMVYIPDGNTFNASASIDITGVNSTVGANITIRLDANKTLTVVIYNNTNITANLTSLGTEIINGKTYNVWNLTVYENGTLTIYALTDPIVQSYKGITLYSEFNMKNLECTFLTSIRNVNATYGANITFLLNDHLTLSKVIYNNTDITSNITSIGTTTINSENYNIYSVVVYENGTLNITATIPNIAYNNTTFVLDGSSVNLSTTPAIIGEEFSVKIPWMGNISVGGINAINTTAISVNTKRLGIGKHGVAISITNISDWKFGYLSKVLNVTYGHLNVTAKGMNSEPFKGVTISAYNTNYSLLTLNLHKLWAGWQDIGVFYHGLKLKNIRFYLNHTTNGANITLDVNATRVKDYRGSDREIYSPHSFKVINLSTKFPYSVMKLCNCSGTVVVNYTSNPPTAVKVEGATSYSYEKPVLRITVNGVKNVTITDLYRLKAPVKDRLGHGLSLALTINESPVEATSGIASKLLKPENYTVKVPAEIGGFKFYDFRKTTDLTPIPWGKDKAGVYWRYIYYVQQWEFIPGIGEVPASALPSPPSGWYEPNFNDSTWKVGETPFADNGYFHRTYIYLNGGALYARHKFNLLHLLKENYPTLDYLNLSEWNISIKNAMLYVSVDNAAWVWVNGKQVLYAQGWGKADISKYLNTTDNLIAVKVRDYGYRTHCKFDLKLSLTVVLRRNNSSYTITLTKDVVPPAAEYRVPTKIITHEYRIASANKFPWLPFPIPFLSKNIKTKDLPPTVRFEGFVRDYYNEPVPNKTIEVIVKSPGNMRIYNITTDGSGNFVIDLDLATGINYTITYKFAGDSVFVGSSTTKNISIEGLPLPPPPKSTSSVLIIAAVSAGIVAIAGGAIYLTRRSKAHMRTKMEDEFKFFKRLK